MRRIRYSRDADALLVELSDDPIDHAEEAGPLILHYGKDGAIVLVEILDARDFVLGALQGLLKEEESTPANP